MKTYLIRISASLLLALLSLNGSKANHVIRDTIGFNSNNSKTTILTNKNSVVISQANITTLDNSTEIPIYQSKRKVSFGGVESFAFKMPGFYLDKKMKYLMATNVEYWLQQVLRTKKLKKCFWNGAAGYEVLPDELPDNYFQTIYKAVPIAQVYGGYVPFTNKFYNFTTVEAEEVVLFPNIAPQDYQFNDSFDMIFFSYIFPNLPIEIIDEKIQKTLINNGNKYIAGYNKYIEIYPNSKYYNQMTEKLFSNLNFGSLIDYKRNIKDRNLVENDFVKSKVRESILSQSWGAEALIYCSEEVYGKNSHFLFNLADELSNSIYNKTLKSNDSRTLINSKENLDKVILNFSNSPTINNIKMLRIKLARDLNELIELQSKYNSTHFASQIEWQMGEIVKENPNSYKNARLHFPNSAVLKELEISNDNVKKQIEEERLIELKKAIVARNYVLVSNLLKSGVSNKDLSFSEFYFIAENDRSVVNLNILFSKLNSWTDDESLLKLYPNQSLKIETIRFTELQHRALTKNWCYECCEIYLSRYSGNPTKRRQVEEWRRYAHNYELAEANRQADKINDNSKTQREVLEKATIQSKRAIAYANCLSDISSESNWQAREYTKDRESWTRVAGDAAKINGRYFSGYYIKGYFDDYAIHISINGGKGEFKAKDSKFEIAAQSVCKDISESGLFDYK